MRSSWEQLCSTQGSVAFPALTFAAALSGSRTPPTDFAGAETFSTRTRSKIGMSLRTADISPVARLRSSTGSGGLVTGGRGRQVAAAQEGVA